jgi:purine-nucleoside phosphorylase
MTFADLTRLAALSPPDAALVLGSGMGELVERLPVVSRVPFAEVPGLTTTGVAGHRGCLTLADWGGRRVLVFEGRLHFYEGHPWDRVVLPVQTAHALGARVLLLTNAAGGIDPALTPGSIMTITDHIEWTRPNCWRQPGPGALGPARPSPYSARLLDVLEKAAAELQITLHKGIYAALTGPCYETPAEIRALRAWGAAAVGMSTAREAQAGFDLGMECAAVSCVTNAAAGVSDGPLNHEEVLATAKAQSARLADLLGRVVQLV